MKRRRSPEARDSRTTHAIASPSRRSLEDIRAMMRHAVSNDAPRQYAAALEAYAGDGDEAEEAAVVEEVGHLTRHQPAQTRRPTPTAASPGGDLLNTMLMNNSGNSINIHRNQNITIDNSQRISPAVLGRIQVPNTDGGGVDANGAAAAASTTTLIHPSASSKTTVVTTMTTAPSAATGGTVQTVSLDDKFNALQRKKLQKLAAICEPVCDEEEEEEEEEDEEEEIDRGRSKHRTHHSSRAPLTLTNLLDSEGEGPPGDDESKRTRPDLLASHSSTRSSASSSASASSSSCSSTSSSSRSSSSSDDDNAKRRHHHRHKKSSRRTKSRKGGSGSSNSWKKRRRRISVQDGCWLCSYGNKFHDGLRVPHIAGLYEIIDKFYGRINNIDLANMIHIYFMREIYYKRDRRKDRHMQILEPYVIVAHLEGQHSLAAMNFLIESINKYKHIQSLAEDSIYLADGTTDYKAFAMFDKVQSKLEKLYMMKIKDMNFNNGATIEDLNSKGAYAQIMPRFSHHEPKKPQRKLLTYTKPATKKSKGALVTVNNSGASKQQPVINTGFDM